eukprot:s2730_g8.t1
MLYCFIPEQQHPRPNPGKSKKTLAFRKGAYACSEFREGFVATETLVAVWCHIDSLVGVPSATILRRSLSRRIMGFILVYVRVKPFPYKRAPFFS